ncbi:hypothetical protein E1A91_D11G239500v1 [Gossypium mustelinum]|uniref:Uncharacterized protein n=1 Tax=Gossypium mustelinum TaxID=34275 RepID=A0A5D2SV34_GOSMU|nr:hypothetical protein E1A91_D11G239500v1 [Gossypium mustelinum]
MDQLHCKSTVKGSDQFRQNLSSPPRRYGHCARRGRRTCDGYCDVREVRLLIFLLAARVSFCLYFVFWASRLGLAIWALLG